MYILGCDDNVKGHRLRCTDKTHVIVNRYISFDEPTMLNHKTLDKSTEEIVKDKTGEKRQNRRKDQT